jgi:hypothetical protein
LGAKLDVREHAQRRNEIGDESALELRASTQARAT